MLRDKSLVVLISAFAMIAAACGTDDTAGGTTATTAATTTAATTTAGGTTATTAATTTATTEASPEMMVDEIVIAVGSLGNEVLDPKFAPGDNALFLRLLYDPIIAWDFDAQDVSTETGIAESWTLSDDQTNLSLTIREGIQFHDGSDLTAEDVQFSLQRLFDDDATSSQLGLILSSIGDPANIRVVGTHELEIDFVEGGFTFFQNLGWFDTSSLVVPKALIEANGEDAFAANPIGTGKYRFVERQAGVSITLEAVDDHFAGGSARIQRIVLRLVPEESSRVAMLQTGEADIGAVGTENGERLDAEGFQLYQHDMGDIELLYFPTSGVFDYEESALADPLVREALSLAIDKEGINEFLFLGRGIPTGSFTSQLSFGYEELDPTPYDPDRARELLAEAGYEDGLEVVFQGFPKAGWSQQEVQETIISAWDAIGVTATIVHRDYGSYRAEWAGHTLPPESVVLHPMPTYFISAGLILNLAASDANRGLGSGTPELDALLTDLSSATNFDESEVAYKAINRYLNENFVVIPILEFGAIYATNDSVESWEMGRSGLSLNLASVLWSEE